MSIFDERYERIAQIRKKANTGEAQGSDVRAILESPLRGNTNGVQRAILESPLQGNGGRVAMSDTGGAEPRPYGGNAEGGGITSPFDGYRVTSRPGTRSAPTAGASTNHKGLDRAMPKGTALSLPIDVTYYRSGSDNARGKWIEFKDNSGNILHYQHLDSYGIFKPGEKVSAGSQIAVSGNSGIGTGAHLHEEYYTPDGQNITESYWSGYANGTKSGAAPVEYRKAGGNIFNVGTNAIAREGRTALSGAYDNLSRYEKVQMLKRRREERREERAKVGQTGDHTGSPLRVGQGRGAYDNFINKYSKSAVEERAKDGQAAKGVSSRFLVTPSARKNFQSVLHKMNPVTIAAEEQNEKAEEYRANNEKTIERAAERLKDENFVSRGVKYRKLAKETAKEWGTENRTTKGIDVLMLGNKEWAEKNIGIKSLAEYMTDEELITYSGLLMTDGAAEAEEYLEAIKEDLRARAFEHEQYPERFRKEAENLYTNPLGLPEGEYQGASLKGAASKAVPSKTLEDIERESDKSYIKALGNNISGAAGAAASFLATGAQAVKNAVGGEYEPTNKYSALFYPAQMAQAAQSGAMKNRADWLKFLKSAGFSITQSAMTAALGGAVGSANAGLAAMGISAGGQSAYEGTERGLTPAQSTTLGMILGTLEAATEKIPLDNMLEAFSSKSAGKQLMINILSSAGENAVQEGVNEIAGNAADVMVAGDRSGLISSAKEYAEEIQAKEGLPDGEAAKKGMKKAFFDNFVAAPIYSALSGAFTGALQTGGAGITGAAVSDVSKTVAAYARGQNAAAAIDRLGYRVELTDDVNLDGKVDKDAKTVYFNPKSDNLRETAKHEITHLFEESGKYTELKEYVKEEMPTAWSAAERRVTQRLERVNEQRAERGLSQYPTDAETIEAETMAEIGEALKTERLTRRFALGKDMPTLMKFIEFARDAGEKVKSKFGTDDGWARAAEIWEEAMYETEKGKGKIENEDVRNKIMENEKGRYVQAERQVISGDNPKKWGREIIDYVNDVVREGKDLEITLDNGEKLKITGRTAWKLGYRNGKKEGKPITDKAYFVKANASGVIDEITSVSQYANSKQANKAHSGGFGDNGFEYRTAYFRDLDGQYYKLTLSVGKNNAGKEVYNIGRIEKASFPGGSYPFWSSKGSGKDAIDSIPQNGEAVNSNIRKSNTNDTNNGMQNADGRVQNEENVRYKIREKFYSDYDKWAKNGYKDTGRLVVGTTSQALKEIGLKDKIITWDTSKINKIKSKHAVDDNIIKQVPDVIENPVIIMQSLQKDSRLTIAGEVYDLNNKPVLAILETEPLNRRGEIMLNEIKIASAYGKDNLQGLINRSEILYTDKNKKRTNDWLMLNRLYLPLDQHNRLYDNSITQNGEAVNSNIRKSNTNDTKERYKIREVPEEAYEMQKEESGQKVKRTSRKQRAEYDDTSFSSYAAYLSQRIDSTEAKNESLKRTNEILKKMAEISGEVHVDALGVAEYAQEIKKQVNTHMPKRDIAARLEEIYTGLAHSGAEDDGSAAYNALFELANDMLNQSDAIDRTMYDRYADLREYLRNTPISVSARDRADIADYADFVKRNRGRIKITKDGTNADKIYEQLAEDYPEFFADTGKVHPSDRLKHIEEVRDSLDPVYDGRRHTDEEAAMLAQDMFANYFTDKNASWEHQTLLEMLKGEMKRKAETEAEEKYKSEAEHYRERAEFYKNLNSRVAERIKGVDSLDPVEPEYTDTDVTAEYGEKYTKNVKFAEGDKSAVRVKRRKRKDGGDTLVIDFDRPTVAADGDHKYKLSADNEYTEIIDRVKKRKKADEGLFEGKSHGGERSYYMHDIWRNCRSFFGERDYKKIKEYVLDPLDDSKKHYQYIQEFYSNVVYDKVVKELGIKKGSRLSELVQKYGEKTMTEEELKSIPEKDLAKIRQADRIFRGIYDGLIDTINETRRKIFPYAEKKAKKLEEALREIREERQMLENAYTSGDLSEVSEGKWLDLKKIEIRRESTNELIYRAQERARERIGAISEQIETLEGEMSEMKNKTTKKYDKLAERLDALMAKRSEMSEFAEAQNEKLKSTAEKLAAQFTENSAAYKNKLAERIALLHQREAAVRETFKTDEISYGREIKKRKDYYRHFEEIKSAVPAFTSYMKKQLQEGTSAAAAIKGFINSSGARKNQNIDNRLAGKSIDTKPKAKWQSFAQKRNETAEATYDAVGGFLDYIPAAAYAAAIDPNISMFRALAEDLAKADPAAANNTDVGSFTGYLQKYANELAGKTNELGDRLITDTLGRNRMRQINGFAGRVKSNMVCYNVSSSLAQILNVPQAIGYMANHPAALTAAVSDTLAAMVGKGKAAERYKYSSFLSERFADDYSRFERGPKRAATGLANFLLGALDEVGTKYIWNAAYRSATAEGSKNPVRYADDVARRMVSGRGIGEMPYYQKSKLIGMFIPFTLEAGNVIDVYSDIIRDSSQKVQGKKGAGKALAIGGAAVGDAWKFLALFAANHFFNAVLEMIRGTDGGLFDPIEDVKEGIDNNYGIAKTAGTIAGNFLGTVPVGGMVAGIYPEYGISIGTYTTPSRSELFGGSDPTRFGSGNLFSSAMKDPINYVALPTGGGQVRKAAQAALAIADGAVKSKSGKVQFEVDGNVKNKVRGMLFGKSGFAEADGYYNPKEVNFTKVPEGFEYKHTSRTITKNGEEVKLVGDDLERFEKVRKARYERLCEKENVPFSLRNPYRTAKDEVSAEKGLPKKAQAEDRKMKNLLEGLIDQGTLTKERAKKIYTAYSNGESISVRGVEYYAPVKMKKTKKFSELTQKQREEYVKQLKSDIKSGEIDEAKGREIYEKIREKNWDFAVEVSEYIAGDYKNLTEEEQKKIRSKMNAEATEFAKGQ